MIRVALDSNVLVYASGANRSPDDRAKTLRSRVLLDRLRGRVSIVLPVQVLGELFAVLRKHGYALEEAGQFASQFAGGAELYPSSVTAFNTGLEIAKRFRLQIWDSLILAAAAEADCTLLLSEDMHHGFTIHGVTIVNPFAASPHPLLAALLDS